MKWLNEEVAILKLKYQVASWSEVKQLLPRRSKRGILLKAKQLGLSRARFSTKGGVYVAYAYCVRHGRVLKEELIYSGKNLNIPRCPRPNCGRQVRLNPRSIRRKIDEGTGT